MANRSSRARRPIPPRARDWPRPRSTMARPTDSAVERLMSKRGAALARSVALACLLSGCAVGPDYRQPQVSLPDHYLQVKQPTARVGSPANASAVEISSWWKALDDRELD